MTNRVSGGKREKGSQSSWLGLRDEAAIWPQLDRALLDQNGEEAHADVSRNTEQARCLIGRQGETRRVLYLVAKSIEEDFPHVNVAAVARLGV